VDISWRKQASSSREEKGERKKKSFNVVSAASTEIIRSALFVTLKR